jgi:predicted anti-sigma-YlaC factor YlaD
MTMNCHDARDRLISGTGEPNGPIAGHLKACPACARFAERMRVARELLRDHHGNVEPDAHFASRVAARLSHERESRLGWAVARVLPATLALLLVLAWLSWQTTPDPASLFAESPTEDLLTWVLDRAGERP